MNGFALLLATALLGVDYGWQPASDGRLEYIVQLEPVTLIALREGQEVVSQIDPLARGARWFRIRVGTDVVPRLGASPQRAADVSSTTASAPPPGITYGWQPISEQQLELLVQIAPERLAILATDPITGEIPPELKNIGRVRIRAGTGNLPRQDLPRNPPPAATVPQNGTPTALATRPSQANVAAAGSPGSVPPANAASAAASGQSAAAPGSSWPPNNRGNDAKQPSRYDPPEAAPAAVSAAAPRAANAPQPPQDTSWQNAAGQNSSWPAAQQPPAGGLAAVPATNPPALNAASQSGLADPSGQPTWGSGLANPGSDAGVRTPANLSPPWGTPDDRYTTDRGQWAGNAPAAAPATPAAPEAAGWVPMVSLPASNISPSGAQSPAAPPSSSWGPSVAGASPQGEMVSPFFEALTTADGAYGPLAALTQPAWQTAGTAVNTAGFPATTSETKKPDFWTNLAEAADDPSAEFLRQQGRMEESDKPWWPLTLAMLALFASMGGNLYMGWIAVDVYRRYLEMANDDDEEDEPYDSRRDREEPRELEDRPRRRERVAVED